MKAADRLGIEVVKAINMDEQLADHWEYPLGINFSESELAIQAITNYAVDNPLGAILAVDDSGTVLATRASQTLGLPHNSQKSALATRDKHLMRQHLSGSGVNIPGFSLHHLPFESQEDDVWSVAKNVTYPCVIKPLSLSGSRGVIRADNQDDFVTAALRLKRLLFSLDPSPEPKPFLVEDFVPGFEVAMEALLDNGALHVLALFDKPDPLDGPFFEETIYVAPSRLPMDIQESISASVTAAAATIGLRDGPVHAELRINERGPFLIEMAGRSIGGLCSHTLRFASESTLEELILRQAFGMEFRSFDREEQASGVMMLPISEGGLLKGVHGCEEAQAVPHVERVEITARVNYSLRPLPEGDSYLGFIFARGSSPVDVENALRVAHSKLNFEIAPELTVIQPIGS